MGNIRYTSGIAVVLSLVLKRLRHIGVKWEGASSVGKDAKGRSVTYTIGGLG